MARAAKQPEEFKLEAGKPGKVPPRVVEELRKLRTAANEGATDFREAVKVQADKHKVKPAALRRYITALARDQVDEARAEAEDLSELIGA